MIIPFIIILFTFANNCLAANDTFASTRISAQGLQLQSERLKVIAQNITNAQTTALTAEQNPYQRKILQVKLQYNKVFDSEITLADKVINDKSQFLLKYSPHHPAANESGYVKYPNIDPVLEMADAKEAQRSFEANLSSLEIARSNQIKILEAINR